MLDVSDASQRENYLSGEPNAYPIDTVWEDVFEIKTREPLQFGDYKISFAAKRDPESQIIERLGLKGGASPVVLMFPIESMEIIGEKGSSIEIVSLLPENWNIVMAQLASFSYMPSEIHQAIIGVNELKLENTDKIGGRLIIGTIDAKEARRPINQIKYDPKNVVPILLWNILSARYFSQINGYPVGENPMQPVLERRTQLLEALKSGENNQQLKELATKQY